ncbi:Uncharacterised protein [Streptococcus pneumoniae]|nr:Uncharacterised protein [Streptococcus pneumoniae]CJA19600.1 Uncharacterised protein [Streptococcus pneumoniae]CJH65883.1 Uncharacterised protein [Streptococcus pneumoniae]CJH77483.1 Uncharacterised protein [Streptococcus pneumoniae]CJI83786.1 Uncharacterised protein [Streptococcus pneumoniae]
MLLTLLLNFYSNLNHIYYAVDHGYPLCSTLLLLQFYQCLVQRQLQLSCLPPSLSYQKYGIHQCLLEQNIPQIFELNYLDSFCIQLRLKNEVTFGIKRSAFFHEDLVIVPMDLLLRNDTQHQTLHRPTFPLRIGSVTFSLLAPQFDVNLLYEYELQVMTGVHHGMLYPLKVHVFDPVPILLIRLLHARPKFVSFHFGLALNVLNMEYEHLGILVFLFYLLLGNHLLLLYQCNLTFSFHGLYVSGTRTIQVTHR